MLIEIEVERDLSLTIMSGSRASSSWCQHLRDGSSPYFYAVVKFKLGIIEIVSAYPPWQPAK